MPDLPAAMVDRAARAACIYRCRQAGIKLDLWADPPGLNPERWRHDYRALAREVVIAVLDGCDVRVQTRATKPYITTWVDENYGRAWDERRLIITTDAEEAIP